MNTSTDLFKLIKSLKQSEKRYFKIFSSTHVKGGQNNYVKLFEAIDKQEEYDEKALIKKFRNEKFTKQFSVTKNYLYNFILKSLRSYYSGKDIGSKINEDLDSIKILMHRGFYKRALKIIKKTKELARQYERYNQLLMILDWEVDVYSILYPHDKWNDYNDSYKEQKKEIHAVLQNVDIYQDLSDQVYSIYRINSVVRTEEDMEKYEEVIQSSYLQDIDNAMSYVSKKAFYSIWALYHTVKKDYVAAFSYDKMQLELLEENPKIKEERLPNYMEICHNLLYNCLELKHYEEFNEILKRVQEIGEKKQYAEKLSFQDHAELFNTTHGLGLAYYFDTRQFDNALNMVSKIKKGLKKYRRALDGEIKIHICFNVCKTLFYNNLLDDGLEWISMIESHDKQNGADGIFCYAKIVKLLIYYEMGESYYDLLQYEIKSTRRYLQKKGRLYQVEDTILKYLYRLVSTSNLTLTEELYVKFRNSLQYLMQQKFEESASDYLNMIHWLDAKIEKIPMRTVVTRDWELKEKNKR